MADLRALSLFGSARHRFPVGRPLFFVEEDAVADAARSTGQEFVVPGFCPVLQFLETLRISESAGELILRGPADRRFEFVHSRRRVSAGGEDKETDR